MVHTKVTLKFIYNLFLDDSNCYNVYFLCSNYYSYLATLSFFTMIKANYFKFTYFEVSTQSSGKVINTCETALMFLDVVKLNIQFSIICLVVGYKQTVIL